MATDATGTPTTNYSIPKYNTSADAPSGLGFNAAMDQIDTKMKLVENKADTNATNITNLTTTVAGKASMALIVALGG